MCSTYKEKLHSVVHTYILTNINTKIYYVSHIYLLYNNFYVFLIYYISYHFIFTKIIALLYIHTFGEVCGGVNGAIAGAH